MEIVTCMPRKEADQILQGKKTMKAENGSFIHFSTWNQWNRLKKQLSDMEDPVLVVCDDLNPALDVHYDQTPDGKASWPHAYGKLSSKEILRLEDPDYFAQTNILMNTSMYDEPWCYPALKKVFHSNDRVCILAMSFFDDTKNEKDWDIQYAPGIGTWYRANQDPFKKFGITPDRIEWVDYFRDSVPVMKDKISRSSILVLPGGAPELFMKRIREKKLASMIRQYQGIVIGYSAGAMIQLDDYHITPDDDYPEFSWEKGLGLVKNLDAEVHFQNTAHQRRYMERAISEKHIPTVAIYEKGGMIIDPQGNYSWFGQTEFDPDAASEQ